MAASTDIPVPLREHHPPVLMTSHPFVMAAKFLGLAKDTRPPAKARRRPAASAGRERAKGKAAGPAAAKKKKAPARRKSGA